MQSCETCRIVNGKADGVLSKRNLIELKGGWTLSHYNEPTKRYLGYLVLATKEHRPDFTALSPNELKSLGLNLAWVTKNLKDYWLLNFPDDLLEQIYFAYFNETPYIKHLIGHELQDSLHFHIHILPRT